MAFATTHCVALDGARGHLIDVQADVSNGQPGVVVVGRADAALREGLDRVRMAIVNSDLKWPAAQRTTILLSPADLPKAGTHFDLAMAVSVLVATGQVEHPQVAATAFIGELTLAGGLRPAVGALPMVMAAAARGVRRVVVPEPQVGEAQMVPDMTVIGVRSLSQVVAVLVGDHLPEAPPVASVSGTHLVHWRGSDRLDDLDFADLRGMLDEKYAAEVAAAGGHALMLSGAKGCGKTSLAERMPTILPDLTAEESLELTALHSLAGALDPAAGMITRPPFAAPHHDASKVSIIGGGQGRVHPGEISRAHASASKNYEVSSRRSGSRDPAPTTGWHSPARRGAGAPRPPARNTKEHHMRALAAAPAALILALGLAACGEGSDDKGGGAADPEANVPKCSDVWVEGETLPEDYEGCLEGDTTVVLISSECEDGTQFTSYDDTYYAVLGGTIGKAATEGGTADDPGYREAYYAC